MLEGDPVKIRKARKENRDSTAPADTDKAPRPSKGRAKPPRGKTRSARNRSSSTLKTQRLLDVLSSHTAVLDGNGRILAVNAAWRRFAIQNALLERNFAIGQSYLSVCDGAGAGADDTARLAGQGVRSVLSGEVPEFVLEYPCHGPTQMRWFRMRACALPGPGDARVVVMHQEVTNAQRLPQGLEGSESWLEEMTDNIGDVLFLIDVASARFLYVSRAYEEVWQRPRTSLQADFWSWRETLHPEDRQLAVDAFAEGIEKGQYSVQYRIVRPDGSIRWLESRGWPVHDASGRVVRVAGLTKDITGIREAAQALDESRRRFAGIVESAIDAILTVDAEQRIVICNPAAESMFGYPAAELLGRTLDMLLPEGMTEHDADQVSGFGRQQADRPAAKPHRPMGADREVMGTRKSGEQFPVEVAISRDDSTGQPLYTAILRDQSERLAAQERILYLSRMHAMLSGVNLLMLRERDTARLFDEACRIAVDAGGFSMALIGLVNEQGRLEIAGAAGGEDGLRERLAQTLGSAAAERTLAAQAIRERRSIVSNHAHDDPRILFGASTQAGRAGSAAVFPLIVKESAIGAMVLYAARADFFHSEEQRLLGQLADDIAFGVDHIEQEKRLHHLAFFDSITGLANRSLFLERVEQRLRGAAGTGAGYAIFVADLERFGNINEALGRAAGDALLRMVAGWIVRHVANADMVARVGPDEFAVLVSWMTDSRLPEALMRKRIRAFEEQPFHLDGAVFRVSATVGAALAPAQGADAATLLRNAETALRAAQARGQRLLFYSADMQESAAERLSMETALRRALEEDQFVLHFQPKRDLQTGALTGAEALIRWNDPKVGLVPPGRFIPLLEQTGLIREVGHWAVVRALEARRQWEAAGLEPPRIAVNVSAVQLRDAEFVDWLRHLAAEDPSSPQGLELEITESTLMEDVRNAIGVLQAVRGLGFQVSIDDFGTGFSSLSYLAKLPIDGLKIDGSFIRDMDAGPEGLSLVSTIINLGHSLRLKVVAEGVETDEQARLLHLLGCDQMQGFLLSPALPAAEFAQQFLSPRADQRAKRV